MSSLPPFSRRHLFKTALLATASGSLTATVASGKPKGRIRKALKWAMIDEPLDTEDKFRLIRDLGFEGVEAHTTLIRPDGPSTTELARASEKIGVPVHGVLNSRHPDLPAAIDQARQLGATSVLHIAAYDRTKAYLQNYAEARERLRRAAPVAERHGIQILIENVWATFLIEPLMTRRFIEEVGSSHVNLYFDIGNCVRWGWPHHWLQVCGPLAKKLDVKEYSLDRAMDEGMRAGFDVPLGQGSIDWAAVRHELDQLDYRGWATAEMRGGDRQRLREISEQMDDVFKL